MDDFEKRFTLRMPAALFEEIKQVAEQNRRSTAREIVIAIEEYVKAHNPTEHKQ